MDDSIQRPARTGEQAPSPKRSRLSWKQLRDCEYIGFLEDAGWNLSAFTAAPLYLFRRYRRCQLVIALCVFYAEELGFTHLFLGNRCVTFSKHHLDSLKAGPGRLTRQMFDELAKLYRDGGVPQPDRLKLGRRANRTYVSEKLQNEVYDVLILLAEHVAQPDVSMDQAKLIADDLMEWVCDLHGWLLQQKDLEERQNEALRTWGSKPEAEDLGIELYSFPRRPPISTSPEKIASLRVPEFDLSKRFGDDPPGEVAPDPHFDGPSW